MIRTRIVRTWNLGTPKTLLQVLDTYPVEAEQWFRSGSDTPLPETQWPLGTELTNRGVEAIRSTAETWNISGVDVVRIWTRARCYWTHTLTGPHVGPEEHARLESLRGLWLEQPKEQRAPLVPRGTPKSAAFIRQPIN